MARPLRSTPAQRQEDRLLLSAGGAVVVTTVLVAMVFLFNLDEVTTTALTYDAFLLGAAALFLASGILRIARWHVTADPHSSLMAAAFVGLGLMSMPLANLTGQLVPDHFESPFGVLMRSLATLACLGLVLRALTLSDESSAEESHQLWLRTTALGVGGIGTVTGIWVLAPDAVSGLVMVHVVVEIGLACAWIAVGLVATRRDATQPWAGRVAPLLGSLGVVEVLRGLDHIQPGPWGLAAAALLASVAMIAVHAAYVDFLDSTRLAEAVARGADSLDDWVHPDTSAHRPNEHAVDFEVSAVVAKVVLARRTTDQEVRVRGGAGIAHGRPADLATALEKLLVNAWTYAPHSPVTVHVVAIGPRIEISVSDRGPGLSAVVADRAFTTPRALQTARALMQGNGGELELRSRIGGATFVVSLPAARAVRAPRLA